MNGKVYIGSSEDVGHRLVAHRSMLRRGTHHSRSLLRAWRKHGAEAFTFETIELVPVEQLLEREQHWIDQLHAVEPRRGFNGCPVAGTRRGSRQPPSVAATLRAVHAGKPKSAEHRAKIAAAHLGRPKHTEASRARLSAIAKAHMTEDRREISREAARVQMAAPLARAAAASRLAAMRADPTARARHAAAVAESNRRRRKTQEDPLP